MYGHKTFLNNGDGTFTIDRPDQFTKATDVPDPKLEDWKDLCKDVRFYGQPICADCSGFLVAPDIVATAAHCVYTLDKLDEKILDPDTSRPEKLKTSRFVFGYRMQDEQTLGQLLQSEVYEGECVIAHEYVKFKSDWVLVKLKRPVKNHTTVPIRHDGKVTGNEFLHIIGHPLGLPLKYSNNAKVWNNTDELQFSTNLDAFGGNSGSPVFNSKTHVVEGILITSPRIAFQNLFEKSVM
jgi:V8-like Glu-specific endopeptidase